MRIITWNVNSIRVRVEQVRDLLRKHEPDALCLQELKVPIEEFPTDELASDGYRGVVAGQKAYNGVAILSRHELTATGTGFGDGDEDDGQQRITRADIGALRIINLYVPNGESVGSEKYDYKLAWLERLRRRLESHEDPTRPLVMVGDYNIAPADLDVYNPKRWTGKVLCSDRERQAFTDLLDWGFTDCLRARHPDEAIYSWWDYRFNMFAKKKGLRIDHVLATAPLAECCTACWVDDEFRADPRPSDHAPVIADFDV